MNTKNLQIMYDYLISNRETIEPNFDMSDYRSGSHRIHVCNSQGCVIGWGVGAFPFEDLPRHGDDRTINFDEMSSAILEVESHGVLWKFLFSGFWADSKYPTFDHAISRLKWVIDKKPIQDHEQWEEFNNEVR